MRFGITEHCSFIWYRIKLVPLICFWKCEINTYINKNKTGKGNNRAFAFKKS
jgi:hypothetical protein